MKLIFEKSRPGRRAVRLPPPDVPAPDPASLLPAGALREKPPRLPEVSELDLVRHYMALSRRNFSVDEHFYPLGSCTMKYNPKVDERAANLPGLAAVHPLSPAAASQGLLQLIRELEKMLADLAGMDAVTLQPAAGAQGELCGLLMLRAWARDRGEEERTEVLIPDSAHGTNPASCSMVGARAVAVRTNRRGNVDLEDLSKKLSRRTLGMMVTNPSTLGLFEENIEEVARRVHGAGGLLYLDGANMNALIGVARPGEFGVDVMHFNLHKTFAVPHGGGGPGAGAVAVRRILEPYLPAPRIEEGEGGLRWSWDRPKSIGKLVTFYGNVNNLVRAYTYLKTLGAAGLRRSAQYAVLNANYLLRRLKDHLDVPYRRRCMHEFVLSASTLAKRRQVRTLDIAKRLLDYGFHAPTIYFPLIVPECLMIEPTETESKETLDAFADALIRILGEAGTEPARVRDAPHSMPVRRLDEVRAAKEPRVRWVPQTSA